MKIGTTGSLVASIAREAGLKDRQAIGHWLNSRNSHRGSVARVGFALFKWYESAKHRPTPAVERGAAEAGREREP